LPAAFVLRCAMLGDQYSFENEVGRGWEPVNRHASTSPVGRDC